MTLKEWTDKWDYVVGVKANGAVYVDENLVCVAREELFHLSDYVVSSVVAGTIWLVRVTNQSELEDME